MRIASLVPSLTETVFDLGRGADLVCCTRYCTEPAEPLQSVPPVGGTKNPKLERLAELAPDVVLVNREENRHKDIEWLRERFDVLESQPRSLEDVAELLRQLGQRLDCMDEAECHILSLQAELTRIQVESIERGRLKVFYPIWKKPWMSINADTYIHTVLDTIGADNICAGLEDRYPVLADERMGGMHADLVLLPSEPFEFGVEHQSELLRGPWFEGASVLLVDGKDFSWHGSRTPAALARLHDWLLGRRPRMCGDEVS